MSDTPARTRDDMDPLHRAVSDTLDEYLVRHHGTMTSRVYPEDFIEWLGEQGHTVVPKPALLPPRPMTDEEADDFEQRWSETMPARASRGADGPQESTGGTQGADGGAGAAEAGSGLQAARPEDADQLWQAVLAAKDRITEQLPGAYRTGCGQHMEWSAPHGSTRSPAEWLPDGVQCHYVVWDAEERETTFHIQITREGR